MKWAGTLNAWAWRKHVKILEKKRLSEDEEYLKELKNKLQGKNEKWNNTSTRRQV